MLESGQHVADYRIIEPLAENQVFQTYLVSHPESGPARLLLIDSAQFSDQKSRQVFQERAQRLLGYSSAGICPLLEVESTAESCFCVYRQPVGSPLTDSLRQPRNGRQALELVRQIAAILSPLHAAALWHGNLSPATIFLENGSPELADFALSSLLALDFHSGVDPSYSSPEQVRGESISAAADIYALGILLYRLLAGKPPFSGADPFAVAMQHVQGDVPRLPDTLTVCQPLLDAMLQSRPDERPTAAQVNESLLQLLALPDDQLPAPEPAAEGEAADAESEGARHEPAVVSEDPDTEMQARIAARLQGRAGKVSRSVAQGPGSQQAANGQLHEPAVRSVQTSTVQRKTGAGKSFVFLLVGIGLGILLYLTLFSPDNSLQPGLDKGLPAAVSKGLIAGSKLLEEGDYSGAERIFTTLTKDYPTFPQPYNNLAAVYAAQGNYQKARSNLERALATDASYAAVYRNLGTIYAEMARDSYGKALQFDQGQQPVKLKVFAAEGTKVLVVGGEIVKTAAATPETAKTSTEEKPAAEEKPAVADHGQVTKAEKVPAPAAAPPQKSAASEPQPQPTTAEPRQEQAETPEAFLRRWAAAWSTQDIDTYLSFYAADFVPASGRSRADWERRRRSRLANPNSIKVTLSDFAQIRRTGEVLQMELTQDYRSDRYSDRTRKRFDLRRKGDRWEILAEHSLGRVR